MTGKLPPGPDEYDVMELGLAETYRQMLSSDFIALRDRDRTVMAIERMYTAQIQGLPTRAAQSADVMHAAHRRLATRALTQCARARAYPS